MYKKIGLFICRHFVLGDKFQQIPGGKYTLETGSAWHYCCSSDSCEEIIHRGDKILCVHRRDKILYVTSELLLYLQIQQFLLFLPPCKMTSRSLCIWALARDTCQHLLMGTALASGERSWDLRKTHIWELSNFGVQLFWLHSTPSLPGNMHYSSRPPHGAEH